MILSFKSKFPWGDPTQFDRMIAGDWGIGGMKCHTIRGNFHWKPGHKIHFWNNNPQYQSRTPANRFNLRDPRSAVYWWDHEHGVVHRDLMPRYMHRWPKNHEHAVPLVYAVEYISITITDKHDHYLFLVNIGKGKGKKIFKAKINPVINYDPHYFDESFKWLALRDGFVHPFDFVRWFWTYKESSNDLIFEGQVIHWTDGCLYHPKSASIFKPEK